MLTSKREETLEIEKVKRSERKKGDIKEEVDIVLQRRWGAPPAAMISAPLSASPLHPGS